ncbi:MAG TPA: PH domain-containing protein [Nocardioidaceae bacterium]|nr:PH domain-containing protein [Nocardioidaceae bacterium]
MAISKKLLGPDEHIVVATRTHVKALLVPALILILTAGLTGFLVAIIDVKAVDWVVIALAVGVFLVFVLVPFLRWLTTEYTVTNRRLITRSGILTRKGHDIPIPRISDVASDRGVIDRMLGCGTLILADASEQKVHLHDIPRVEEVQLKIANLLHGGVQDEHADPQLKRLDDGT